MPDMDATTGPATDPGTDPGDPGTDPAAALLRLLAEHPDAARDLAILTDFDIARRDPVENLSVPSGLPLEVVAGDASGGSFFLVGDVHAARRPVLYTDSEGGAALVAEDLAEALAVFVALGWWHDAGYGSDLDEMEAELREYEPELDEMRAALTATLGLPVLGREQARDRLLAAAARTAPDFVPIADFSDATPYELLFAARSPES